MGLYGLPALSITVYSLNGRSQKLRHLQLGLTYHFTVMFKFSLLTTHILPGWVLNIAALLLRAEAILAVTYIFIVHFFVGHLRPSSFPMNEAMFSGSVHLDEALKEKPAWVERLKKEGRFELAMVKPPARWYRVLYFVFGYTALGFGLYVLINGIYYGRYIQLH